MILLLLLTFDPCEEFLKGKKEYDGMKALEHYRRVLTSPDSPCADSALLRIGLFYYLVEDWRQAENTLNIFLKRYPDSPLAPKARFWLGNICLMRGDTAKAFTYLDEGKGILSRIEKEKIKKGREVYAIQIGSFRERKWAELRREEFEKKGYQVRIVEWRRNGEVWYRVVIGAYDTREEAAGDMKKIKEKEGISAWITKIWIP
ncbi:hypothetical protein DRQ20_02655 [bacterium]|nr:MAG: hypothetical protein DRQ20_02655 [bacterium]